MSQPGSEVNMKYDFQGKQAGPERAGGMPGHLTSPVENNWAGPWVRLISDVCIYVGSNANILRC